MTLQERYDALDGMVRDIEQQRAALPSSPDAAGVRGAAAEVGVRAMSWTGGHILPPQGDPAAVSDSAARIDGVADRLRDASRTLPLLAGTVEDGIDADAGRASAVRVHALADVARLEREGLRIVVAALLEYATRLEDARSTVSQANGDVWDARAAAGAVDAPSTSEDWSFDELCAAIDAIDDVYGDASAALRTARDAVAMLLEAERMLGYALSDAGGYARLAGLPASSTTTALDAVVALAAGVADPDRAVLSDAEWEAYVAARDALTDEERARLDAALEAAGSPTERQVIMSALATGAGVDATIGLADRMQEMTDDEIDAIAGFGLDDASAGDGPYGVEDEDEAQLVFSDDDALHQQTNTTCGAASLLMLAAQHDPFLALLIDQGELVGDHVPPYLDGLLVDAALEPGLTPAERFEHFETAVRDRANDGLWPPAWGTRPWGFAPEVERIVGGDVDFDYTVLGGHADAQSLVDQVVVAVDGGSPVPLLVGGDDSIPMHYVLVVGHSDGFLEIFEPGSGQVIEVPIATVVANEGGSSVAAYGNWTTLYGAAIPQG